MVIKMRKPEEVRTLDIRADLMGKYEEKLQSNRLKEIGIMKVNNENECSVCGKVYNIHVKQPKVCGGNPHQPTF